MWRVKNEKTASFLAVLMAVLCLLTNVLAQTETARIQGIITDKSGGVVPGATVTVRETATNRTIKAETNEDGAYTILSLSPGRYQVEVNKASYKTVKQEITLEVQQVAALDYSLEAGDVSAVVDVTNDTPLVETTTSALGGVVQAKQIVELPLNGRNVLELARLTPGVTQGVIGGFAGGSSGNAETYRGGNTGGASLSINGQRTQANNFLLDGVDNNESLVNTINIFPSADAVQEFRVQTSVAAAEFGRGGGGIINTVTRSGANRFYGSSYLFIRNDNLDARPAFDNKKSEFRRGQFGGTVGGPVWKDKVFFFASYEGLREFLPRGQDTATVPTEAFRKGDFSLLLNPALSGLSGPIQLIDPLTQTPIAGNRLDLLPAGRLNAAALKYLNAFPLPNNGSRAINNYVNVRNQLNRNNVFDTRIDYKYNDTNQFFFRGNYGDYEQTVTSRLPTLPSGFGSGSNPTDTRGMVFGWNRSITSSIFNELRLQFNRIQYGYEPPFGDQPISANLGIANANRDASLGGGALIGGYNGQLEYTGDYGPYRVPQNTYQIVDSLAFVRGNHTFKMGGSIVKRNVQLFRPIAGKGYFRIYGNGDFTQCPGDSGAPSQAASGNTGFEQANLLIGFMCSYQIGFQNGNVGTINWENAAFFQDDWRVNNKLTLNLGLRYEYLTNPAEKYGRQANFDLTTGRLVLPSDNKDSLTDTDKNNFGPRAGFAYDLRGDGRQVLRGGYGLFYFLDRGGIDNQLAQNPPFSGSLSYNYNNGYRITLSGQGPLNNNNNTLANQPLPLPQVNTSAAFLNNPANANVLAVKPDNRVSNTHQFNIQFQQQITNDTALSVGYIGTRSRNLIVYYNLNGAALSADTTASACPITGRAIGNCYPGVGSVIVRDDLGKSNYDSLQIQLERRFSRGWQYVVSYTLSDTKDNGEGAFDKAGNSQLNYIEPYANSRLDYPHVFSFQTVYELPFGIGRQYASGIAKPLDYVVGGWSLNSIFRIQSGSPFDVRVNNRLVNLTGDAYTNNENKTPYLNRASFNTTGAASTAIGSLERNSLRSPSTYQWNLGLSKNFGIWETVKLQFRMEAFNILNNIQWGTPNTDFNNASTFDGFGTIRGTAPFSNRQIQFGLRMTF